MYYVLGIVSLLGIAALIWYFFMVPLGRERYERELELVRRKLERRAAQGRPSGSTGADDRGTDTTGTLQ